MATKNCACAGGDGIVLTICLNSEDFRTLVKIYYEIIENTVHQYLHFEFAL